jgi:hypothetical protein
MRMEAVSTSEMSVNFYETTRRNVPQDCHLHDLRNLYEGESNENRKTEIKIRNIAPLSYKLADMLPML